MDTSRLSQLNGLVVEQFCQGALANLEEETSVDGDSLLNKDTNSVTSSSSVTEVSLPEHHYKCSRCDYISSEVCDVLWHSKTRHTDAKHSCSVCPFTTNCDDKFSHHVWKYHAPAQAALSCHLCPYTSLSIQRMLNHLKRKHPSWVKWVRKHPPDEE